MKLAFLTIMVKRKQETRTSDNLRFFIASILFYVAELFLKKLDSYSARHI